VSASDIVTILASLPSYEGGERGAATKTITPDGKGGLAITDVYKGTKWWSGHERAVDGIDSLADLLERVSRDPCAMIVRGRIADGVNRDRMFRRKTTRADGTGTIHEAEHRWLLIDVDSLEADFDPLEDVSRTVRYVTDRLPEAFRGVTCWFQHTSGAGIKPGIRIRLAFWLDRALGTEDLKLWLGAKADKINLYPVDTKVFVCTHPDLRGGADHRRGRLGSDQWSSAVRRRPRRKRYGRSAADREAAIRTGQRDRHAVGLAAFGEL
jgi:hypothetical protein